MLRRPLLADYRPAPGRRPVREVKLCVPPEQKKHANKLVRARLPASRKLVWVLVDWEERCDEKAKRARDQLMQPEEIAQAYQLAQQFRGMVRDKAAEMLEAWLAACRASTISELVSFADGLGRELPSHQGSA